mgnify:FL=1
MPVCTYCATHIQPLQELPTEEVAECIGIVRQDQVSCFGITIGSGSGSVRAHKGGASECDMGGKCRPPSLRFDQCAIEQRSLHTTQREMLKIGSNAPEIDLLDQHGDRFRLSELRGKKNAVIFFYPADDTTICTVEACAFRDSYETFVNADTEVIGISAQDAASHQRFANKFSLPFRLLVDDKGTARKAYHVGRLFGLLDHRLTYVIDEQGLIIAITKSTLYGEKHVADALAAIP